jgi:hypothetical protein
MITAASPPSAIVIKDLVGLEHQQVLDHADGRVVFGFGATPSTGHIAMITARCLR